MTARGHGWRGLCKAGFMHWKRLLVPVDFSDVTGAVVRYGSG